MTNGKNQLRELLGEARAIHYAMQHCAISYETAKLQTRPLLRSINEAVTQIAKRHNMKPKYIQFQDLGSKF